MTQENLNTGIFSEMTDKAMGNDENIGALLQNIPAGLVMYEWDGQKLKPLYVSDYYAKRFGSSLIKEGANDGGPDFMRVHPDDVEGYKAAVVKAIHTTLTLNYVYRLWNDEVGRYLWTKIDASSKQMPDGKVIIYALYTDVTAQIDAKLEAEKNAETLKASIAASGQFCFEFDPKTNYMICPPEQAKLFDLPADYIDFPESLFAAGGILEEARPVANELMEKLHRGVPEAECELLMYTKGVYLWYRFCFHEWYDPSKGYPIYLCSFANINDQKVAQQKYLRQMEIIAGSADDSLGFSPINVSQNICYVGNYSNNRIAALQKMGAGKLDASFAESERYIPNLAERERFHDTFNLSNLIEQYNKGITHIALQHRFLVDEKRTEWVENIVDLVENPSTHDIEGYVIAKSINAQKMQETILQRIVERDYRALIYFDRYQDEYMMFDNRTKQYFVKQNGAYTNGVELVISGAVEEEKDHLRSELTKEKILRELADHSEYILFYGGADYRTRYELTFSNVDEDNRLVICVLRDVTDETLLEKLTFESEHDTLTGLYNREKALEECNKLLRKYPDTAYCMIHVDIQRFRLYNSFFGDAEGDKLLQYLSEVVCEGCRGRGEIVYGRIEADNFVACVPYDSEEEIKRQNLYIRKKLACYRDDFQLNASVGVYCIKDRTLTAEACYNRAVAAAKSNRGKMVQSVKFFDDAMEHQLQAEQRIVKEMQNALKQEQFVVYLQPKYELFSGEPYGGEALVRWQHPERGLIPPGEFIPLFESNGFITALDRYMWEHTCQLIHKWIVEGRTVAPISVNVSRVSMYSPQTVPYLMELVKRYEVPVELLNLELTESAYMDNPDEMKARLNDLRAVGFKIMMDDFGSGYSSLNTLREIPVDYLKVDRVFLASVDRDKRSRLVLSSVVHMASRMGIPVITEGVETVEQKEFLSSIGCDYVQGYLYAKPMPVESYEKFILERDAVVNPERKDWAAMLSRITMNMDVEVQAFADLLPHAVAFVDFVGDDFAYLSANKTFQIHFGMNQDVEDMTELIKKHITKKNYDLLTEMYRKVASSHAPTECFITWKNRQNSVNYYLVRAQYVGSSAYSTVMIVTFIDLTELSQRLVSTNGVALECLEERDIYTMKEIGGYLNLMNQSFDVARLVHPETMQVIASDANDAPARLPDKCRDFWGKSERCTNCTTLECIRTQRNQYKVEEKNGEYYLTASHPVRIRFGEGTAADTYAIEVMTRLTDDVVKALHEKVQLLDKEHMAELQEKVYEDSLTTVYNRRYFKDMLFLKDPEPGFRKGEGIAFVVIDLDSFKRINDSYGHSIGDQILIQTANMLRNRVRSNDSVIRYDGDEFLVVYNNTTEEYVQSRIPKIKAALAEIRYSGHQEILLRARIGYSFRKHFSGGISEAQRMVNEADRAIQLQKEEQMNS